MWNLSGYVAFDKRAGAILTTIRIDRQSLSASSGARGWRRLTVLSRAEPAGMDRKITLRDAFRDASLALVTLLAMTSTATPASLEYAVKAAYLYKFVPFVEWPETSFAAADSPINICVSGKDPFGQILDQAAVGQRVAGRAIVVRHLTAVGVNSGCHVMYIGGSAEQSISQGLEMLRGQPVLTVSDAAVSVADRGIVNFVIDDSKVRFEIDEHAAEQNHLTISSKLLSLARKKPW
jgi:hypothetical protein